MSRGQAIIPTRRSPLSETLLVIKTRAERCDALASRVGELHPYDVPEVVELQVAGGSDKYLKWIVKESAP